MSLLEISNLCIEFPTTSGMLCAVDQVRFELKEGEILGVVGESGSGKSVTMLVLMGWCRFPAASPLIGWLSRDATCLRSVIAIAAG
jgi:ABC-type dipeptide/oligopeptide/nickel transport system ATPase component